MGRATLALRPCWTLRTALVRMKDIITRVNGCDWGGEMVRLCYSWRARGLRDSVASGPVWLIQASKDDIAERHVEERLDICTFEMFKNTQFPTQVRGQRR